MAKFQTADTKAADTEAARLTKRNDDFLTQCKAAWAKAGLVRDIEYRDDLDDQCELAFVEFDLAKYKNAIAQAAFAKADQTATALTIIASLASQNPVAKAQAETAWQWNLIAETEHVNAKAAKARTIKAQAAWMTLANLYPDKAAKAEAIWGPGVSLGLVF